MNNKKPSVLTIRIPNQLKHELKLTAYEEGVSINQLALLAFANQIRDAKTNNFFRKYYQNKNEKEILTNFDKVMSKVSKRQNTPSWDKI